MKIRRSMMSAGLLLRRSARYLLVSRGFRVVEAAVVLVALGFVLTGSRIAAIDRLGNRSDIVAAIAVTALTIALLKAVNRRVLVAIDGTADEEVIRRELETAWEVVRRGDEPPDLRQRRAQPSDARPPPDDPARQRRNEPSRASAFAPSRGHAPRRDDFGGGGR